MERAREPICSVPGFRTLVDDSDAVGEGGVTASEVADETDLAGGVAMVGDDDVVAGDCSDLSG